MFWKILEFIIRIVYFRRFQSAKKIGVAGTLLANGSPEDALRTLEKAGTSIHESLLPLYAFTQGKIFLALGRLEEAEKALVTVVLADPQNARADLELAILTGKQFRFTDCRNWLERAMAKENETVHNQAMEIRDLLDSIESGARKVEFETRAHQMATREIPPGPLGSHPDLSRMDEWIRLCPQEAREALDDMALLVGQSAVEKGGTWKINLSIEDSVVIQPDGSSFNPFEFVARRF